MAEKLDKTFTEKLDKAQVKKVFDIFDYNGNGVLSLAEIDRAVIELYPDLAKNKLAIMRAYKAADTSKDGLIDFNEFERLINHLHYYELLMMCKKIDKNNDNLINFMEFKKGHKLMGIIVNSDRKLKEKFNEIDTNKDGYIFFEEFCTYAVKINLLPEIPQDVQKAHETRKITKKGVSVTTNFVSLRGVKYRTLY
ncbi:hypothetical protein C1645_742649 [Glomus cerebriforme]|uniref:EF-hand domain-containing protein n=1 Tax=Glomus cerebriforme TaxID=658196 RepID=A0A397SJ62_9GLOM|nr:hypothetical protein C1645_742649 [Glomus cerebriforme]